MIEPLRFPETSQGLDVTPRSVSGEGTMGNLTSGYLDFAELEAFNERLQKCTAMEAELRMPVVCCEDARVVLVSYGISSRLPAPHRAVPGEACGSVWAPRLVFSSRRTLSADWRRSPRTFLSVERQRPDGEDIRLAIDCRRPVGLVLRYGGNLLTLDQVMDAIRQAAG